MIEFNIPGYRHLKLSHLVLDFNGTLAQDGRLHVGVRRQLIELAEQITVHVVTGNTFGTAKEELHQISCEVVLLEPERQARVKREFVQRLGAETTVVIGNGQNDVQMMHLAFLAIAVVAQEGAAREALDVADVVAHDTNCALELLQHTQRLVATLRA